MVFDRIKQHLVDVLDLDPNTVTLDSDIINDLDADSLDIAQMLLELENVYKIEFDDDDIKTIRTVGDIVKFIENNLSSAH
ncbi:MAG: acyl carrier protein [Christensenellaceae bacterium]|jgi:acyl carrier protein|nr:acyl carrier protein [Christensenellaceae bacterium]